MYLYTAGNVSRFRLDYWDLSESRPRKLLSIQGETEMMEEKVLNDCTDAPVWAQEFCKRFPNSDEGTMLGWFANAIQAGYDQARQDDEAENVALKAALAEIIEMASDHALEYNEMWGNYREEIQTTQMRAIANARLLLVDSNVPT
jgi:hypothetical protein